MSVRSMRRRLEKEECFVRMTLVRGVACCGVLLCMWLVLLMQGGAVSAAVSPLPAWGVTAAGIPSVLPSGAGHHGRFTSIVENTGGAPSEGGAVVRDVLPAGLTAVGAGGGECSSIGPSEVDCTLPEPVASGGFVAIVIEFEETGALAAGSSLSNRVTVSGGGAAVEAAGEARIRVRAKGETGAGPAGIALFSATATDPAGEPALQAGAHPTLFTTSLLFNSQYLQSVTDPAQPVEAAKDLVFYLPLGMLGDSVVADQCPASLVETHPELTGCPPGSRIGTILPLVVSAFFGVQHGIYNITPEKGYAAEFAFTSNSFTFVSYASLVRHDGTYMVRVATPGVPAGADLVGFSASFYGDLQEQFGEENSFDRGAFLTNPSDCNEGAAAREASVAMDTWEHPDFSLSMGASSTVFPSLTGCKALQFSTGLDLTPDTTQADEPSGLEVGLEVPQAPNDASGLGTPPVKSTTVSLPIGATISPSSANGLEACAETGPEGIDIEGPESEEVAADGLERPAHGHCPFASQVATVTGSTPLLREELKGHMYLAEPQCGGEGQAACTPKDAEDGKLVGLYLEMEGPNSGAVVKLEGHASVKPGSGQITVSFDEIPQFPIGKLTVTTKHGPRAPLANPQTCGAATMSALVTPWSPETPAQDPSATYNVDWDGHGEPCPASAPFAPSFSVNATSPVAAAYTPLTVRLERRDREQNIGSLSTTLPQGLTANLSQITRCGEPQASDGTCASGQIGTVTAAVGAGKEPYYETGEVFLTEGYKGKPFGLSIVVPAVAGPFNLGDIVVRAALAVDPATLRVTAETDPLPQEIDGVPLRLRLAELHIDAHEFMLNPTTCSNLATTGAIVSTAGSVENVSSPFATNSCKYLDFRPKLTGTTEQTATKAEGTGVNLKVTFPVGHEANIASFSMAFPKELPVRLETLQKACPAATFEANPASCPPPSVVGTATVHTPLLRAPLVGPIYLVSYGNAKFPNAVLVLQGEGITVKLTGESSVSSASVLTLTVPSIPDQPFSTFEATLPKGPFSEFTSSRHLRACLREPVRREPHGRGPNDRTEWRAGQRSSQARSPGLRAPQTLGQAPGSPRDPSRPRGDRQDLHARAAEDQRARAPDARQARPRRGQAHADGRVHALRQDGGAQAREGGGHGRPGSRAAEGERAQEARVVNGLCVFLIELGGPGPKESACMQEFRQVECPWYPAACVDPSNGQLTYSPRSASHCREGRTRASRIPGSIDAALRQQDEGAA